MVLLHVQLPQAPAVDLARLRDQFRQSHGHRSRQHALPVLGHEDQVKPEAVLGVCPRPVPRLLRLFLFLGVLFVAFTHALRLWHTACGLTCAHLATRPVGRVEAGFNPAMNCGAACPHRCSALLDRT